ncbi:unnamed protein product [Mesocestoides corti]|uniref:Uncharacterized protein n=1 Tax=Mesocestoides corti TaxID=53468 RepID=A0A0R3UPY5_MESCO|nr:unnamed protein product [Mesocestoides corti]
MPQHVRDVAIVSFVVNRCQCWPSTHWCLLLSHQRRLHVPSRLIVDQLQSRRDRQKRSHWAAATNDLLSGNLSEHCHVDLRGVNTATLKAIAGMNGDPISEDGKHESNLSVVVQDDHYDSGEDKNEENDNQSNSEAEDEMDYNVKMAIQRRGDAKAPAKTACPEEVMKPASGFRRQTKAAGDASARMLHGVEDGSKVARNSVDAFRIIRQPITTEAVMKKIEDNDTLVFVVDRRANKPAIKAAAEEIRAEVAATLGGGDEADTNQAFRGDAQCEGCSRTRLVVKHRMPRMERSKEGLSVDTCIRAWNRESTRHATPRHVTYVAPQDRQLSVPGRSLFVRTQRRAHQPPLRPAARFSNCTDANEPHRQTAHRLGILISSWQGRTFHSGQLTRDITECSRAIAQALLPAPDCDTFGHYASLYLNSTSLCVVSSDRLSQRWAPPAFNGRVLIPLIRGQ